MIYGTQLPARATVVYYTTAWLLAEATVVYYTTAWLPAEAICILVYSN